MKLGAVVKTASSVTQNLSSVAAKVISVCVNSTLISIMGHATGMSVSQRWRLHANYLPTYKLYLLS